MSWLAQCEDALEVFGEVGRAAVALVERLGHRHRADRDDVDRHGRRQAAQRARFVGDDRAQHVDLRVAAERLRAGEQLVEHCPERIDVGAVVDRVALRPGLLRAHVGDRAQDHPRLGHLQRRRLGSIAGQAEVDDAHLALRIEHQVLRLDVAVHDLRVVSVLQRARHVAAQPQRGGRELRCRARRQQQRLRGRLRPPRTLVLQGEFAAEVVPGDILHREVVRIALGAVRVDRHDARMAQSGRGLGAAVEAVDLALRCVAVAHQHLERDLAPERDLPCQIDRGAHPAAPEFAHDLEVAEPEAVRQRGGRGFVVGQRRRAPEVGVAGVLLDLHDRCFDRGAQLAILAARREQVALALRAAEAARVLRDRLDPIGAAFSHAPLPRATTCAPLPRLPLDRAQGQAEGLGDHVLGLAAVQAQEQDLRADRADSAQALQQFVAVGQIAAHGLLALAQAQLHDLALGFPALLAMPVIVDQDQSHRARQIAEEVGVVGFSSGGRRMSFSSASPTRSSVCRDTLGL